MGRNSRRDKTETLREKRKAMWEKMNKPENKTEALRARLQREEIQLYHGNAAERREHHGNGTMLKGLRRTN